MTVMTGAIRGSPPADLVTRAESGDEQAWDALVERYAPLIQAICRKYGLGGADADDVGQCVLLRLVDRLATVRDPAALPGWLITTTRRECGRVLRQKQTKQIKPPTHPAAWRQLAYMHAIELQHDLEELCDSDNTQLEESCDSDNTQTVHDIEQLLVETSNVLGSRPGFRAGLNGGSQERAFMAIHQARMRILSIIDSERLLAMLPSYIARCRGILGPNDARVRDAEKVLKEATTRHALSQLTKIKGGGQNHNGSFALSHWERATIAALVHDAYTACDEMYAQTRNLRNRILVLTAGAISLLTLVIAAAAIWNWQLTPTASVAGDPSVATWAGTPLPAGAVGFLAVSLLGCVGAFLSGVRSVSRTASTRNPFNLSWWQSWLKLPVGALTAIVGIFALQSHVFPADPATRWVELLMWAIAFGAAQQAVTRFVDSRVQGVVGDADRER